MAVVTFERENTSALSPARLYKAFIIDLDTLLPKVLPQLVKTSELIEGNGGPGSIRKISSAEGKSVVHKIEAADQDSFSYTYSVLEDEDFGNKIEKITYDVKFVASNGGSIVKITIKIHKKEGAEITDEEFKAGEEKVVGLFKAFEGYLLANPEA